MACQPMALISSGVFRRPIADISESLRDIAASAWRLSEVHQQMGQMFDKMLALGAPSSNGGFNRHD